MMNQRNRHTELMIWKACVIALAGIMVLSGCDDKSKKKQAAPVAAPAPAPPPPPRASLNGIKLDPKVQFPEDRLPESQEALEVMVKFASALASGDASAMKPMISPRDAAVLDGIVQQGEWTKQTGAIKVVRFCKVSKEGEGYRFGLGLEDSLGAFLSGWEVVPGSSDDGWRITSLAIEPKLAGTAKALDDAELALLGAPTGTAVAESNLKPILPKPEEKEEDETSSGRAPGDLGRKPDF